MSNNGLLAPKLPKVGDIIHLFGLTGSVESVVPENDWNWCVSVQWFMDESSEWTNLIIPTDAPTC